MTAQAVYDDACAIVRKKRRVCFERLTDQSYAVREVETHRLVGHALSVSDGGFRFYSLIGIAFDMNDAEPTARAVVERAGFFVESAS